jgi:AcrR family transcriptional regulator
MRTSGAGLTGPAPRKDAVTEALLAAALDIVTSEGVSGLTLRPLAKQLGVSPAYVTSRFGSKAEVWRHIVEAARCRSVQHADVWSRRLGPIDHFGPDQSADICEAILDDMVFNFGPLYTLYLEALQACAWDEPLRASFQGWLQDQSDFWAQMGAKFGAPDDVLASGLLHGYIIDELAYSLCLSQSPAYRLMRKLTLSRIFSGFTTPVDIEASGKLFFQVFAELDYDVSALRVVHGAAASQDWPGRVVQAAARLITTKGVSAVTHRAVAALADVKPTTLAYRFATQEDLVIGGLEHIIARLITRMDDPSGVPSATEESDPGFEISRATFAVALAAARMDRLKPCAADMRRRRGINLIKVVDRQFPDGDGLDAASAQGLSSGLTGLHMTPLQDGERDAERVRIAFEAAIDWAKHRRLAEANANPEAHRTSSYKRFPIASRDNKTN